MIPFTLIISTTECVRFTPLTVQSLLDELREPFNIDMYR